MRAGEEGDIRWRSARRGRDGPCLCLTASGALKHQQHPYLHRPSRRSRRRSSSSVTLATRTGPSIPVVSALRKAAGGQLGALPDPLLGDNASIRRACRRKAHQAARPREFRLNTQVDAARASGPPHLHPRQPQFGPSRAAKVGTRCQSEARSPWSSAGVRASASPERAARARSTVDVGRRVCLVLAGHPVVAPQVREADPLPEFDLPRRILRRRSSRRCARRCAVRQPACLRGRPPSVGDRGGAREAVPGHGPRVSAPVGGEAVGALADHWLGLSGRPARGVSAQDLSSGVNRHMWRKNESVFRDTPPLAFLHSHDRASRCCPGAASATCWSAGSEATTTTTP